MRKWDTRKKMRELIMKVFIFILITIIIIYISNLSMISIFATLDWIYDERNITKISEIDIILYYYYYYFNDVINVSSWI